ncbi:MAG: plasmid recombination protein [Deltaproteobacteria bacterium]|nr:plasmid recombination protein [Deltaproteobacteria bacterium]
MVELLTPVTLDHGNADLKVVKLDDCRAVTAFVDHVYSPKSPTNSGQWFPELNCVLKDSGEESIKALEAFIDGLGKHQDLSTLPGSPNAIPLGLGLTWETDGNCFDGPNGAQKIEMASLEKWCDRSFQWAKAAFGSGLISVVLHGGEQSPHIHLLVEGQCLAALSEILKVMAPHERSNLGSTISLPGHITWLQGNQDGRPQDGYCQPGAESDNNLSWFPVGSVLSRDSNDQPQVKAAANGLETDLVSRIDNTIVPMEAQVYQIQNHFNTLANRRANLKKQKLALFRCGQKINQSWWNLYHQGRSLEAGASELNMVLPSVREIFDLDLTALPEAQDCGLASLLDFGSRQTSFQDEKASYQKAAAESAPDVNRPDPLGVFSEQTGVPPSMVEPLMARGQIFRDRCDGLLFPVKEGLFFWDPLTGIQGDMGLSSWELESGESGPLGPKKRSKPICLATSHPVQALILKNIFAGARVVAVPNNSSINLKPIFKGCRVILVDQIGKDEDQRRWVDIGGPILRLQPLLGLNEFAHFLQTWRKVAGPDLNELRSPDEMRCLGPATATGLDLSGQNEPNQLSQPDRTGQSLEDVWPVGSGFSSNEGAKQGSKKISLETEVRDWYRAEQIEMRSRIFFRAWTGIELTKMDLEELWKNLAKKVGSQSRRPVRKAKRQAEIVKFGSSESQTEDLPSSQPAPLDQEEESFSNLAAGTGLWDYFPGQSRTILEPEDENLFKPVQEETGGSESISEVAENQETPDDCQSDSPEASYQEVQRPPELTCFQGQPPETLDPEGESLVEITNEEAGLFESCCQLQGAPGQPEELWDPEDENLDELAARWPWRTKIGNRSSRSG